MKKLMIWCGILVWASAFGWAEVSKHYIHGNCELAVMSVSNDKIDHMLILCLGEPNSINLRPGVVIAFQKDESFTALIPATLFSIKNESEVKVSYQFDKGMVVTDTWIWDSEIMAATKKCSRTHRVFRMNVGAGIKLSFKIEGRGFTIAFDEEIERILPAYNDTYLENLPNKIPPHMLRFLY